jgi:hypothetical protein
MSDQYDVILMDKKMCFSFKNKDTKLFNGSVNIIKVTSVQ